jgi:Domain of unknown function (DUF4112)
MADGAWPKELSMVAATDFFERAYAASTDQLWLRQRKLKRMRWLVNVLDTAIRLPGGFRFGADSIFGLAPGVGDAVTTAIACYFVWEAHRMGLPPRALLRMGGNVATGLVIGAVPVLGDLFDTVFKANVRNLAIIEEHFRGI